MTGGGEAWTHPPTQTDTKATYRSALRTASARRFSCSFLSLETLRSKSIGVVVVLVCVGLGGVFVKGEACVWGCGGDEDEAQEVGSRNARTEKDAVEVTGCSREGLCVRVWCWVSTEQRQSRRSRARRRHRADACFFGTKTLAPFGTPIQKP